MPSRRTGRSASTSRRKKIGLKSVLRNWRSSRSSKAECCGPTSCAGEENVESPVCRAFVFQNSRHQRKRSADFFRWLQEPFNPATLSAAQECGRSVRPIQTEERHTGGIEKRRGLVELIVTAESAHNCAILSPVSVGGVRRRGGVKQWFVLSEEPHIIFSFKEPEE